MCDGTSSWREDIGQCGNRLILNGALYWPHGIVVVIKSWRDWNNQNVELIVRDLIGSLLCWCHLNTCDYLDNKIGEFVHIKNNRLQVDVDSLLVSVDGEHTVYATEWDLYTLDCIEEPLLFVFFKFKVNKTHIIQYPFCTFIERALALSLYLKRPLLTFSKYR